VFGFGLFGAEMTGKLAQRQHEQEVVLLLELFVVNTGKTCKVALRIVVGWACSRNERELIGVLVWPPGPRRALQHGQPTA